MKVAFSSPLSKPSDKSFDGLLPIRDRESLLLKEASNDNYFS
jgi:hypothetical protein